MGLESLLVAPTSKVGTQQQRHQRCQRAWSQHALITLLLCQNSGMTSAKNQAMPGHDCATSPCQPIVYCLRSCVCQASCQQRAGRAGRVRPGHAFRLCTEEDYQALLPDASVPEMQRSELAALLLQLKVCTIDCLRVIASCACCKAGALSSARVLTKQRIGLRRNSAGLR